MITFEQDSDVLQWGLQLFESDPYLNCGYTNTVTPDDESYYYGQHFKEDHYDTESCDVESDELIAHALQEELSQLAVSEASESPHETEENLQGPVFQHGWVNHSEEADDTQPSSLCSSHEEESYCGEEWSYPQELTDEYALDGEVGKRLNQMVPVPHVPRINGEIPSIDEATLDHQRLLERLQVYDLVEHKVQGDGNCQFRALSDQIYRTAEHHEFVRQQIVAQLKSNPDIYEGYVPMAYGDYLEKMSKSGEWGDHVTLQAAADLVCLIMAFFLLGVMPDYSCFLIFQFCLSFFSRIFCESLYLVYPLNLYVAMDPRFPYSLKTKRWSLECAATVKIVS
ncbi:OTU domain-containing protein [Citrus sinensis]|nr:OTU domain-containing protein [Citrus sinensis]